MSRTEVQQEGNLLIEAVALLVQRQRETESWVAEQIWQAEERFAVTDRRYTELEARLVGIEEHLARLANALEPAHGDAAVDERLARLREQLEGLKSGSGCDGRPTRVAPPASERSVPVAAEPSAGQPERPPSVVTAASRFVRPAAATGGSGQNITFWDLLGPSPQDRWGLVLIGAGAVAVLYAILSQVRFG